MIWDYNLLKESREYRLKFYQSSTWRKAREVVLGEEDYLCRICRSEGKHKLATVVDHIIDIQISPHLFLDRDNLQPLCAVHHMEKTKRTTNNPQSTGIVNSAIDLDLI